MALRNLVPRAHEEKERESLKGGWERDRPTRLKGYLDNSSFPDSAKEGQIRKTFPSIALKHRELR